jgi:hypothetical protein
MASSSNVKCELKKFDGCKTGGQIILTENNHKITLTITSCEMHDMWSFLSSYWGPDHSGKPATVSLGDSAPRGDGGADDDDDDDW